MATYYSVATDKDQLCDRAAEYWLRYYADATANKQYFYVALSGGSTPKNLYRLLASEKYSALIDWKKVQIFFGDERCVPHDHPDSNYRMAKTSLFDHIDIPQQNVHPIPYHKDEPMRSAEVYQHKLLEALPVGPTDKPQFDLVLLGMGDDGHTASLFPGTTILQEQQRWVSAVHVTQLDTWRISLTFPLINNAINVVVLVSGISKADKISEIFASDSEHSSYPIESIEANGDMLWLLDKDAASKLDSAVISDELAKIT